MRVHLSPGLAPAVIACSLVGLAAEAQAAIVVNIYQSGADVVSELSGSFNTSGGSSEPSVADSNTVWGGNGFLNTFSVASAPGTNPSGKKWTGSATSTPGSATRWGEGSAAVTTATTTDSISGFSLFRLDWFTSSNTATMYLDNSYNGAAMTGRMTFASTTMTTLGLDNYGSFVFTFSSSSDTVTVNLLQSPPSAVPGAGVAGLATLGFAGLARRRRR